MIKVEKICSTFAHIPISMKLLYPFLLLLLSGAFISNAQSRYNFGEGVIQVQFYFSGALNLEHPDTANGLFMTFTYYVKGSRVLRSEDAPLKEMMKSKSIFTDGKSEFKTALVAHLFQPTYLLDFDQNKSYVYYSKHDSSFASVSTIADQQLDLFYKCLLLPARENNRIVQVADNGTGYGINGKDTSYFKYAREAYSIPSPLGNIFSSHPLPYITFLCTPMPGTGKDGKVFRGYGMLTLSKIAPMNLPDSLFSVRPGVVLKENVSLQDMNSL